MNHTYRPSEEVKAGLLLTFFVTCMLAPVIIIAWAAKWIYHSRK